MYVSYKTVELCVKCHKTSLLDLYILYFSVFSKLPSDGESLRRTTRTAQAVVRVQENTAPNSFYTYLTRHLGSCMQMCVSV